MTPHSWHGVVLTSDGGPVVCVQCATCAIVVPVTHLPQWQGLDCHVARARTSALDATVARNRRAVQIATDDAATVAAFLASLHFGMPR